MLISLVIPTFNSSSYIRYTIDSIINQNHQKLEIIIIDDNSDDFSILKKIICEYTFSNENTPIHLYKNPKKMNASYSRNFGATLSKGEYIVFLDSDDILYPNKINYQLSLMEELNLDWSYTALNHIKRSEINHKLNIKPISGIHTNEDIYDYLFLRDGLIQTSTIMIRKKIINIVKFNEDLERHQDYDYCEKLLSHNFRFKFINEPLTYWILPEKYISPINKKQTYNFCINWLKKRKISKKAQVAYIVKNIILVGLKSKQPSYLYNFIFSKDFNLSTKINVFLYLLTYSLRKLCR
ncbi:glycosyltransferase family 2 protein [Providencia rettgeri]